MRNPQLEELGRVRPTALVLLRIYLNRAKNTEDRGNPDLEVGEAYLGDWKMYTKSEQIYRTDKSYLEKYKILTYRATNRGTIARLVDTSFFDVEWKKSTDKSTDKPRASHEQATTNKEIREKKDTGGKTFFSSPSIVELLHPTENRPLTEWEKKAVEQNPDLGLSILTRITRS